MIAAEESVRAWINRQASLVGDGNPLAGGAYTQQQRSPSDGSYAVIHRLPGIGGVTAEAGGELLTAALGFLVFSGAEDVAERAAAALAERLIELKGMPEPCAGDIHILVSDRVIGPAFITPPAGSGEQYCFQVTADLTLADLS